MSDESSRQASVLQFEPLPLLAGNSQLRLQRRQSPLPDCTLQALIILRLDGPFLRRFRVNHCRTRPALHHTTGLRATATEPYPRRPHVKGCGLHSRCCQAPRRCPSVNRFGRSTHRWGLRGHRPTGRSPWRPLQTKPHCSSLAYRSLGYASSLSQSTPGLCPDWPTGPGSRRHQLRLEHHRYHRRQHHPGRNPDPQKHLHFHITSAPHIASMAQHLVRPGLAVYAIPAVAEKHKTWITVTHLKMSH